jgi:hypothetical protein
MPSIIKPEDIRGLDDYLPNDVSVNFARAASDINFGQKLATRGLVPVANRTIFPFNGFSSGSSQTVTYRTAHFTRKNSRVTGLRVMYNNATLTSTGEATGNAAYTVAKAAIEYNGVSYPILFGGARDKALALDAQVLSDPVVVSIPANTQFWIRTYVTVAVLGEKWPVGTTLNTALGETYATSDIADGTTTPTLQAASGLYPSAILGLTAEDAPHVLMIGSSSGYGQGDTVEAPSYDLGYLSRALSNEYCYSKLTRASTSLNMFLTTAGYTRQLRHILEVKPTHIIQQLGSNDLTGGASLATMQSRLTEMRDILSSTGAKVYQCTATPVTTSSDNWATLAGQTLASSNTIRLATNEWIKSLPTSTLSGYIDCCKFVETSPDQGYWKTDGNASTYTTDGTHLTQFAHRGTAATIDIAEILGS